MGLVEKKYAREIWELAVEADDADLKDLNARERYAYNRGFRRGRHDAAMLACSADADISQLAEQLVQAHNQLMMAAECIEKNRLDEALLHCESLVRPRRNTLGLIGVNI